MVVNSKAESPSGLPMAPGDVDQFLSEPTPEVVAVLDRMPGPVAILGAGGKLGLHFSMMVQKAFRRLGRKDPVLAVSRFRTLRDRGDFERHGIQVIACDFEDSAALARLPDAATVIFLAGVKFGTSGAPELLRRLNVEMPRKVAERFRSAVIMAFSSGCVYPFVPPDGGGATEETRPAPVGDYAASCLARERAFTAAAADHGTRVVLIRLNYAVEFRYGLLLDIAENVLAGRPVDVATGYVNVIWQRDAVVHSLRALELADSAAPAINITGPAVLSVRDIARRFGRIFGREPVFAGEEEATAWLSNASRSHRLFGPPPTTLDDMIGWTAAWLTGVGLTWGKPTGFERRTGEF